MSNINTLFKQLLISMTLAMSLLFSNASHADDFTVKQLMQMLAKATPDHATFIETKQIALLDQPVVSSGELFFTAPDHLEKRTLLPKPESLTLDGNKILIERGSKTYYFTLQNLPELGILVNSIRGTLAGDLNTLERHFVLNLEGGADQWLLQLVPNKAKMQKLLTDIQIAGSQSQIQTITVAISLFTKNANP